MMEIQLPPYLLAAFHVLGSLALLMFGMKLMSETLQKMAGPQLRHVLGQMTTNRFTGMLTGMTVTAAVQSSTATTVMTVSFVNAGLLTLAQAISVIMGANIGTTLTAWIISAGVSFNITDLVWPTFLLAMFLLPRRKGRNVGDFLFGVSFMILGLGTLRQTGVDLKLGENEAVLGFFSSFDPNSFTTTLLFLLIGGVLTMCVQSSVAVMAITMILCSSGALPIYQGIALVMGENIGTTVTSNLAALTASTQARRAAFAHMFFNLFGVVWMLVVFHPFIDGVCSLVGYDVTMTPTTAGQAAFLENATKLNVVLAAFHTCFNVVNTGVLIGFIPQIERIVCWVIKPKATAEPEEQAEPTRLKYIGGGLVQTPEIAVLQAQKEVTLFGTRVQRMFDMVRDYIVDGDDARTEEAYARIGKYEGIADNMEIEIARYLEQVGENHLSDETKAKVRAIMRQISELESIADSSYRMARIMERMLEAGHVFSPDQQEQLTGMMLLADEALSQMNNVLQSRREDITMDETWRIENLINDRRDSLKADNIAAIEAEHRLYAVATVFADLVSECEKVGDYVVNVVQTRC